MDELFENIIKEAIAKRVTDLHFKSRYHTMIEMRYRDHILPFKELNAATMHKLMSYLLYRADIDLNQRTKPQTGSFSWEMNQKKFFFRLSYLPSDDDLHLVLRLLNHHQSIGFNDLTDDLLCLDQFHHFLKKESGMIIICGPTGSGKSTTLHAFLEEIQEHEHKSLITIEDPIEIYQAGIVQIQINEAKGMTFQSALKQILRHDPDVIMIGEIRDEKSASLAFRLALTGHLVLTTLHAKNPRSALLRLQNFGLFPNDLIDALLAIVSQRLVYTQQQELPICFFEIAGHQDILSLLNQGKTASRSMNDRLQEAVRNGQVQKQEIESLLED